MEIPWGEDSTSSIRFFPESMNLGHEIYILYAYTYVWMYACVAKLVHAYTELKPLLAETISEAWEFFACCAIGGRMLVQPFGKNSAK